MTSLLRHERRYVKRWANGTWGSARCKFWSGWWHCVHILACLASFLSVRHAYIRFPGYMIHTWSSLATCFRSRSRKGGWGGGAQLNQFPSWLLANYSHTHRNTRTHSAYFFLFPFGLWAELSQLDDRKGKGGGGGFWWSYGEGSVMLLLMSLI